MKGGAVSSRLQGLRGGWGDKTCTEGNHGVTRAPAWSSWLSWGQHHCCTHSATKGGPSGREGVRGEPHPRGLPRLPTSVLLVSVMSHAQPHASCRFAWQLSKVHFFPKHHQTDCAHPRQSTLPVMTKSKLVLALGAALYRTALGNLMRTRQEIQPVRSTM